MDNWFYVQDGNRVGPVSEEQLKTLHQAGAVEGQTLIWRKGLKEWQAYDKVFPPPPGKKAADLVTEEKKNKPATPPEKPASSGPPSKPPAGQAPTAGPGPETGQKPTPPPPPPEAYAQQTQDERKPQASAKPAEAKPHAPQKFSQTSSDAPAKLPKPIKSKGTEERWKSAGPTFSLAPGKREEPEEGDADKPATQSEPAKPAPQPDENAPDSAPAKKPVEDPGEKGDADRKEEPPSSAPEGAQTAATGAAPDATEHKPEEKPVVTEAKEEGKVTPSLSENQKLKPLDLSEGKADGDLTIDGPAVERAICAECQKPFPVSMMDQFGRKRVCKLCQARMQEKYQQDLDRKQHKRGLFTGTLERILLVLVVIGLVSAVLFSIRTRLSNAIDNISNPFSYSVELPPTEWVSLPPDEWPQLVMLNSGTFAESSPLRGGTSFLIKGGEGEQQAVGVTSSTLLNPDYGVYPPVHPASIPYVLANWKMYNPSKPQEILRFSQTVGDPFAYLDTPVLFLQLESTGATGYPVEVLEVQEGPLSEQFVYIVTMQPRGQQYVQTVYSGTAFPNEGPGHGITIKLPEAVSDMEVPGSPILDSRGRVVGMVVGSSPFQGHMPIEDFEQLTYTRQAGNRTISRRRDVQVTTSLYGVDVRAFPDTVDY